MTDFFRSLFRVVSKAPWYVQLALITAITVVLVVGLNNPTIAAAVGGFITAKLAK